MGSLRSLRHSKVLESRDDQDRIKFGIPPDGIQFMLINEDYGPTSCRGFTARRSTFADCLRQAVNELAPDTGFPADGFSLGFLPPDGLRDYVSVDCSYNSRNRVSLVPTDDEIRTLWDLTCEAWDYEVRNKHILGL